MIACRIRDYGAEADPPENPTPLSADGADVRASAPRIRPHRNQHRKDHAHRLGDPLDAEAAMNPLQRGTGAAFLALLAVVVLAVASAVLLVVALLVVGLGP